MKMHPIGAEEAIAGKPLWRAFFGESGQRVRAWPPAAATATCDPT
jgi:hypothetical protein